MDTLLSYRGPVAGKPLSPRAPAHRWTQPSAPSIQPSPGSAVGRAKTAGPEQLLEEKPHVSQPIPPAGPAAGRRRRWRRPARVASDACGPRPGHTRADRGARRRPHPGRQRLLRSPSRHAPTSLGEGRYGGMGGYNAKTGVLAYAGGADKQTDENTSFSTRCSASSSTAPKRPEVGSLQQRRRLHPGHGQGLSRGHQRPAVRQQLGFGVRQGRLRQRRLRHLEEDRRRHQGAAGTRRSRRQRRQVGAQQRCCRTHRRVEGAEGQAGPPLRRLGQPAQPHRLRAGHLQRRAGHREPGRGLRRQEGGQQVPDFRASPAGDGADQALRLLRRLRLRQGRRSRRRLHPGWSAGRAGAHPGDDLQGSLVAGLQEERQRRVGQPDGPLRQHGQLRCPPRGRLRL
jgi:hypothetical protein